MLLSMYMTFRSMEKEKGRKSVAAVKAKTKRRRLREKKLLRLHANQQITPLTCEECPSNGDTEEAAVDSGIEASKITIQHYAEKCHHFNIY